MESPAIPGKLRALPSVDVVLRSPELAEARAEFAHDPLVRVIRRTLDWCRSEISSGAIAPSMPEITARVLSSIHQQWSSGPIRVLNATGVVLHTNLGRAPLSRRAIVAMSHASGYVALEMNMQTGRRDSRQSVVAQVLCDLTGAEGAHVVCNNAAAVTLVLASLASSREVLVSRGQAVEIGGGFRVPSILRQSGARLKEVGTTNRTRISDYEEALSPRTAGVLHVHASNFRMSGFAEETPLEDLAALVHGHGLPLISDNGSGSLLETEDYGLRHEPTPSDALRAGADVVCFSGDKLLGGPQSGIILGREAAISRIERHPLARAVRPDKVTLAALAETLLSYVRGTPEELPVWQMISARVGELQDRVDSWALASARRGVEVEVLPGESTVGGGSLPGEVLPTVLIQLPRRISAPSLRRANPIVVARTHAERTLLDLRTIAPEEDLALLEAVCSVAQRA